MRDATLIVAARSMRVSRVASPDVDGATPSALTPLLTPLCVPRAVYKRFSEFHMLRERIEERTRAVHQGWRRV